jgi:hypothetical protein
MAGYVASNILKGDVAVIHWDEINKRYMTTEGGTRK